MLVSQQQLSNIVQQYGDDYTSLVFNAHAQPPATIDRAVQGHAPTFHDVTSYFSRQATLLWLRFHIAETFAFLGIYDTASKRQVIQTAELILSHELYAQLNLDEFLCFLQRFKCGDYGKIYQSARPNPQELLVCLQPFWNELQQARERADQQQQLQRDIDARRNTPKISTQRLNEIKQSIAAQFAAARQKKNDESATSPAGPP